MRILVEQLNGETFELEVTAEMSMRALKEQLKRMRRWEDELSRDTTFVDLIMGDKKVMNEETVEELGLCDGSKVTVIFRKNVVKCCDKSGLSRDREPEALVIVEIPDSETEIGAQAFEKCRCLANVIIPSSVTQIGHEAFLGCTNLVSITIPNYVTQIDAFAFSLCRSLVSVDIPDSVTQIGNGAFCDCTSLVTINIPLSVTQIRFGAFCGCSALTAVIIPDSIRSIGDEAFSGCSSLVTINIPDSVQQIWCRTFSSCGSLTSVDIPHSVTVIEGDAFSGCNQLTLTAPARLLGPHVGQVFEMVAKECRCDRCDWTWFSEGWVCPKRHCGPRGF